ncbi:MAG: nucleotidyltransferase [Deltaproteobacteria bacterium]|nr:nucleotidyltransferase [Deltaproteobacteria bacterium]
MLNEDYKEMLQLLLEEHVDFMIVGAYALGTHGYPRATGDIDIWVKPNNINSKKLYKALARFGAPLDQIRIDEFSTEGIIFQIGVIPRRIDIITKIDGVTYEEADEDKIIVEIEGLKIPVISLEKLIRNKMATGREKDELDIKTLTKKKNS